MKMKCIICNLSNISYVDSKNGYKLFKCLNCSFVFIFPRPSLKSLQKYYLAFDYTNNEVAEARIRKDALLSLRFIGKYVQNNIPILDLGCGRGFFLDEARSKGWKVKGVDYSKNTIKYAIEKLDLDVIRGDINTYKDNHKYGLVTMSQVIEHIYNPNLLLNNISKLLQKDGYLYIVTPNFSSASSKVFQINFEHIIPPEHINYFNKQSLVKLLHNNGFRVVSFGTWGYPENTAGIIKHVLHLNTVKSLQNNDNQHSFKKSNEGIRKSRYNIKYMLFDQLFCGLAYRVLDLFNLGINIQVIAQKI